jgi:phosphoribosylformimino-5-aminoimidazole carboxamide ribotide isomerase
LIVIPAIDLKDGRCVRLVEGRADSVTVYDGDPVEVARTFQESGASLLHVVDLDGAFLGAASTNQQIIRRIIKELRIQVEVGGGIRSIADISTILHDVGARYAVVGTLAIEQPDVLKDAIDSPIRRRYRGWNRRSRATGGDERVDRINGRRCG